jgi:hypothetical protein
MAESAPAAPAPVAPAAPTPQAGVPVPTAPKPTHHSATQPRDDAKRFAGAPEQKAPAAPRMLKVADREIPEEEALALLEDKVETQRLTQAEAQELARLRAEAAKWKEPHKTLTRQQREEIAAEELRSWQQAEEEKALPPEVRAFRQQQREFARQREEFQRQQEEVKAKHAEALNARTEEFCKANVYETFKVLGMEPKEGLVLREITRAWQASAAAERNDTPRVIAMQVQKRLDAMAEQRTLGRDPKALLSHPKMAEKLNALKPEEVAGLFELLGPFFEVVRTANLQRRGLSVVPAPGQAAAPTGSTPAQLASAPEPSTSQGWLEFFRNGGQPDSPARHKAYWALKDRGAL